MVQVCNPRKIMREVDIYIDMLTQYIYIQYLYCMYYILVFMLLF